MKNVFYHLLGFFSGALTMFCALLAFRDTRYAPHNFLEIVQDPTIGPAGFVLIVVAAGIVSMLWIASARKRHFPSF